MTFTEAVRSCFRRYALFSGRASRSEYWFFVLFCIIVDVMASVMDRIIDAEVIVLVASLALFLPSLAVGVRRLHDIDRSGWWVLLSLLPIIGSIVLIVWACAPGTPGPNRFGPDPLLRPVGDPV